MRINIAMGPWFPVPAIDGGAVHRCWQSIAEAFAIKGHQVTMLCRSHPQQPASETINGVRYVRSGGFPQSTNIKLDLIKDLIYAFSTFPSLPSGDILMINDFWLPVFAPWKPGVGKIVFGAARFPKKQYWLYQQTDLFVAVSQAIAKAIEQQYPKAQKRIQTINNNIDCKIFSPPIIPRQSDKQKTILYVGRIHPEKGLDLLLKSFALITKIHPETKLKIIGPYREYQGGGGEHYLTQLKDRARGLPVEFCEPIFEPNKLADVYRQADLFCYPSLAEKGESFGVAPLEAMATGLVPIVSNLDCFKDFIEAEKTGYFFDHRSSDKVVNLAKTLKTALTNWSITKQMGTNAANKAKEFSQENIANKYLELFENLLCS